MPLHLLTNFEIQTYYQNAPKSNRVYSINNLSKIKDGTYRINLDEHESTGTDWIALYVNADTITYFNCSEVGDISKEKKSPGNKNFANKYSKNTSIRFNKLPMLLY